MINSALTFFSQAFHDKAQTWLPASARYLTLFYTDAAGESGTSVRIPCGTVGVFLLRRRNVVPNQLGSGFVFFSFLWTCLKFLGDYLRHLVIFIFLLIYCFSFWVFFKNIYLDRFFRYLQHFEITFKDFKIYLDPPPFFSFIYFYFLFFSLIFYESTCFVLSLFLKFG